MTFRVVRANLYNQDLGLIHSTNGNHLECPNEGSSIDHQPSPPSPCAAAASPEIFSGQFDEENPFVQISSVLLVQADEGVSFLVMDRIGDFYRSLPRRAGFLKFRLEPGTSASKNRIKKLENDRRPPPCAAAPIANTREARDLRASRTSLPLVQRETSRKLLRMGGRESPPPSRDRLHAGCETMRDVTRDDDAGGAASRDTACALAARMFFVAAPPAGCRSGESPTMS
ncbi:hypothetical protein F511_42520 [Dorcoceras hygrometricum]|uniref:Uncharacterized protein n=1 Tax=Dorcoceras hygrometricum TaxID=472368 RepID=A0A2Z7C711_9LAMI|nr:hypothetical protein F511_42520 [Dorcoceras hygrometricum]